MAYTPESTGVAVPQEKVLVALLNLINDGKADPLDRVAL
jgi:hypothetical protein